MTPPPPQAVDWLARRFMGEPGTLPPVETIKDGQLQVEEP